MGIINIDDVKKGMTLADDIKDYRGLVLLRVGTEMMEKHLRICKMWGITEADVEGVDSRDVAAQAAAAIDPERLQAAEAKAREAFCQTDLNHPMMQELFHLYTLRHAQPVVIGGPHDS